MIAITNLGILALMITNNVIVRMSSVPDRYTATISWAAPSEKVDAYRLYYSTSEGVFTNYIFTPFRSVTISNLWTGVEYYYTTSGMLYCGGSTWSESSLSTQVDSLVPVRIWLLSCPSNYTLQSTLTLQREVWLDYQGFLVTNDYGPMKLFRATDHSQLKLQTH
jgi:hypothetical protein